MLKKFISCVCAALLLLSGLYIPSTATVGLSNFTYRNTYNDNFKDIAKSDWYYESVIEAYKYGLMVGKSSDSFDPKGNITIAEIITVAARLNAIYGAGKDLSFTNANPWYTPYVSHALINKIDLTNLQNRYTAAATRSEFAQVIASAMPDAAYDAINTVDDNMIPDVKSSTANSKYIYKLYRAGIIIGNDTYGTYYPDNNITRAEVAAIIVRLANIDNRLNATLSNSTEPLSVNINDYSYKDVNQYIYNLEKECSGTDEDNIKLIEQICAYLDGIKSNNVISDYEYKRNEFIIQFSNGILFSYLLSFNQGVQSSISTNNNDSVEDISKISLSSYKSQNRNIITMQPFAFDLQTTDPDDAARLIANSYSNYIFNSNIDNSNVNVDSMSHLDNYKLIILDGHGASIGFCTGEQATDEKNIEYNVYKSGIAIGSVYGIPYYVITPAYISTHYNETSFTNSVIFISCCHSADDDSMANAFINNGASAYYGFKNEVYSGYSNNMLKEVFNSLSKGRTTQEALNDAKSKYGNLDTTYAKWYHKALNNKNYKIEEDRAELRLIGDTTYTLNAQDKIIGKIAAEDLVNVRFKFIETDYYSNSEQPLSSSYVTFECLDYTGSKNYNTGLFNGMFSILNSNNNTVIDYVNWDLAVGRYKMKFSTDGYDDTIIDFTVKSSTDIIKVSMSKITSLDRKNIKLEFIDYYTLTALNAETAYIYPDLDTLSNSFNSPTLTLPLSHEQFSMNGLYSKTYCILNLPIGTYHMLIYIEGYEYNEIDLVVDEYAISTLVKMKEATTSNIITPDEKVYGYDSAITVTSVDLDWAFLLSGGFTKFTIYGEFIISSNYKDISISPTMKTSWGDTVQIDSDSDGNKYYFSINMLNSYKNMIDGTDGLIIIAYGTNYKEITVHWDHIDTTFEY